MERRNRCYVPGIPIILIPIIFAVLAGLLVSVVSFGTEAPDVDWIRAFGDPEKESTELGFGVRQTTDGGFIIVGTGPGATDFADVYLIKTSASGQEVWGKTFGGASLDWGSFVRQTGDGGYIITGYTYSYGAGESDVWLIKTDAHGNKVWDRTFGGSNHDYGFSVQQTADGGFVVVGHTLSFGNQPDVGGIADTYLIKIDAGGNKLWEKTFGGNEADLGHFVCQTTDGGYIIVGETDSEGDHDIYLVKTDASGNKLWEKTFGGPFADMGACVQQTNDGGYIIVGSTSSEYSKTGEVLDVYLIKTDASGNKLWDKTFGGNDCDVGSYVEQTNDGGYIIMGGTVSYSADGGDFWFIKTDAFGNKLWDKTVDAPGTGGANWGQQTSDCGYVAVGSSYTPELYYCDIQLVKLKPEASNQPPNTEIVDASISGNTATFTWTGRDDTTPTKDLVYAYRLVRPGSAYDAWSSWSSGKTKKYTDLSPGNYKFQVRARDTEKAIDPSPASREFTIGEGALKCAIELRKQDTSTLINTIDINKPFDIYVGASTGNPEQVRFSSDESQDATPTGEWTDWYDWDVSSGDWDANTKTTAWSFATSGKKEVWAEIKDSNGNTGRCHANIFVHPGYAIVVAGAGGLKGGWVDKPCIDHAANNAYRALRNLGFDNDHIFYLNTVSQTIDGKNVVDASASYEKFENVLEEIKIKIANNPIPLILYLVGHGVEEVFDFNPRDLSVKALESSSLKSLLVKFSSSTITIIIVSCYSGSFITKYYEDASDSISADNRIIITATHDDCKRNLFACVRSSDCLWGDLVKGVNVKEAYTGRTAPSDKRHLWLDDNGDCIGHPPHTLGSDGKLAAITRIGVPGSENLELTPWIFYWKRSPGELRVYDSQGRVTGLVDGEVKEEIPSSLYDEENEAVAILSPSNSYYCQVVGTDEGSYGLEATSIDAGEATTFTATDIATTSGAIHQYTIDWDVLARGEDGVTLQVDSDGDGTFERTIHAGSTLDGTTTPVASQPPQVNILAPVMGEVVSGVIYQIQWQAVDPDDAASVLSIDIVLSGNGGASWTTVAADEENDGFYNWDVSGMPGGNYILKIIATDPHEASGEATTGPFTVSTFEGQIIIAPNPVTGDGAAFYYALPEGTATTKLMIFNVTGRPLFETPLDVDSTRFPSAGTWNPVDQDGVPLANGPYVYVLIADGKVIGQGKMVIQR